MGTIKIELDLPDFKNEVELKIIINKDGVQSGTPLVYKQVDKLPQTEPPTVWKQTPNIYPTAPTCENNNPKNATGVVNSMIGTF